MQFFLILIFLTYFIIANTFSIILFLISIPIFIIKILKEKIIINFFDFILLIIFIIYHPVISLLNNSLFSNLTEWKVYISTIMIALITLLPKLINKERISPIYLINTDYSKALSYSFIIFSVLCLISSFPSFVRFPDYSYFSSQLISQYYSFFGLIILSISQGRIIKLFILFFIVLGSGGSGIIGLASFLILKSILNKKDFLKKFLNLIVITSILLSVFIYGQIERGRDFSKITEVDRVIINSIVLEEINNKFNINKYIFGLGPNAKINIETSEFIDLRDPNSVIKERIKGYLKLESPLVSGKNFHNDYLRYLFHFGIIGLYLFMKFTYKIFKFDTPLLISIFIMSLFNSFMSTTICLGFVLLFTYIFNTRYTPKT